MYRDFETKKLKKIIQGKQRESTLNRKKIEAIKLKIKNGDLDILNKESPQFHQACLKLADSLIKDEEKKVGLFFRKIEILSATPFN